MSKSQHKSCTGDHKCHLCVLASQGRDEEMEALSLDPQFICYDCCRTADKDRHVCNPYPIAHKDYIMKMHR